MLLTLFMYDKYRKKVERRKEVREERKQEQKIRVWSKKEGKNKPFFPSLLLFFFTPQKLSIHLLVIC